MKIFVTGVGGQLGFDVAKELTKRGHCVIGSDVALNNAPICEFVKLDITDFQSVNDTINKINPDAIIHCAAWTAVDAAEDAQNKEKVFSINADGTKHIAVAAKKINAKMMYISTDYVFNGQGNKPWDPDSKEYSPINEYGKSKLNGEKNVVSETEKYFIVRIAWVFGNNGNNFIKTMVNLSKKYDSIRVVNDQIGTPTYTIDLAKLLAEMIVTDKYGYYHATNEGGYISWYDFAKEIMKEINANTKVISVSTQEYGLSKAKRPFNSRLDKTKLTKSGFKLLPDWKDALKRYLKEQEVDNG